MPMVGASQAYRSRVLTRVAQARALVELPASNPTNRATQNTTNHSFSWDEFPADTLLEVASYLRDDRYALLNLTRVCGYWRRVLTECPLNWTRISTRYPPKLFKMWLQRSGDVPIDAEICDIPLGMYGQFRMFVDKVD
jgi:hypothetical protein